MKYYDYQQQIIDYISNNSNKNVIIMKSRQTGLSSLFVDYLKKTNKKTVFFNKQKIKINNENVKSINNISQIIEFSCEDLIIDEAAFISKEEIENLLITSNRKILYSSLNYKDDFFYKLYECDDFISFKIHWTLCPRLNPSYPFGIDYKIINELKKTIGQKIFDVEYEMIQPKPVKDNTITFRISDEESILLDTLIKNESLKRGKLFTKTEFIKHKLFNIE